MLRGNKEGDTGDAKDANKEEMKDTRNAAKRKRCGGIRHKQGMQTREAKIDATDEKEMLGKGGEKTEIPEKGDAPRKSGQKKMYENSDATRIETQQETDPRQKDVS